MGRITATHKPIATSSRGLLIIEDDASLGNQMRWALSGRFSVHLAGTRAEALSAMAGHRPALVVLDLGLPPDTSGASEGLLVLDRVLAEYPGTKVIVASGNADRANAMRAIALGAYDFFAKPVDIDQLQLILDRAWHLRELEEENRRLSRAQHNPLEGIIAASPAMLDVCRLVERVAPTDVSVLIRGESGTGKEVLAQAIHRLSARAKGQFIAVNCAAIPDNLLESELFGYERGAFTGAFKQTAGKVEQARGGTLFLDEIGDMPVALQAKMLRFLQNHSFQRLGGREEVAVDLRVIAASNRDLENMITTGAFREDLFFRLNEVTITAPPLRARNGDSLLIAHAFLQRYSSMYRRRHLELSQSALAAITEYAWPGNVRELENRIKRAVVLARDTLVMPEDIGLPNEIDGDPFITLKEARRRAEVDAISKALASSNHNLSRAAKILGVSRPTLYNLLAGYEMKLPARHRDAAT